MNICKYFADAAATNKTEDDVSTIDNWSQISTHQCIVHSLAASVKDNLRHTFQHCQDSNVGSSVLSHINSVLNAPHNPPSQVSFAQPTVVHHFDPYGTLGNNTASTADTTCAPTIPGHTVDYPSFPTCHTPSVAFGSLDVNLRMASVARNVKSTDLFSHTLPHARASPHAAIHTGSPAVSTLPTFHGKTVNPAPVLGSVPPPSGPLRGPPSGSTGHLSPLAPLPAPSGPSSYHCPPVPSPPGPPIPPLLVNTLDSRTA